MTALALTLVLIAAFLHATWNLCAKRAGGGLPFVWLVGVVICACYVPVTIGYVFWKSPSLSWTQVAWICGSGLLKTAYSLFLQRAYRMGDFSLIYPLARGTGPLLSTIAAIALLGERPTALALAGGLVIVAAIFVFTGGTKLAAAIVGRPGEKQPPPRITGDPSPGPAPERTKADGTPLQSAVSCGIVSGILIASYTIWDQQGVYTLRVPPILYDAGTAVVVLACVTPFAMPRWPEVKAHWRNHKRYVFGTALLSPIAYVLVLTAMTFTPVSYIAPAREVSIVIGAFIGARYLKEADGTRRIWAAVAMAAGVIALALG